MIEFDLFSDAWYWQIKNKKLINKGTGLEYLYDPSKKGYDLGNGMIIEASDKWKFCREKNESFKIKCTTSGSFLKANYNYDADCINSGNLSLLQKNRNHTHRIDLNKKSGHQRLAQHERGHPEGSKSPSFSTNLGK